MNSRSNIIVVGGAGYIGSHTCKALAMSGYHPVVYDNLSNGHIEAVKWGPLEQGDILERKKIDYVFKKYAPEGVMHFAAYTAVGESVQEPGKFYRNNVVGSLNLLESMRENNVDKMVFSSTCAIYGIPEKLPLSEDHPQNPINPYGASKAMTEKMLFDFSDAYHMKTISLRYFNAAGADPEKEIGASHYPMTHIIPIVIEAACGQRPFVEIYGSDYPTPDGTGVRDYIHVSDLADAHILALEYLKKGGESTAFNLGTGTGYSVRDVIRAVEKVSGKTIKTREISRRPGDAPIFVAKSDYAEKIMGWKAKYVNLEDIVKTAYEWHKRRAGNTGKKI